MVFAGIRLNYFTMLLRYLYVSLLCSILTSGYGASVDTTYDTIVVGLGSAGTTAATTLARAGKRVLALEAQDRIGGRVHTIDLGEKGVVELGAEWIHGIHPSRVYDAAVSANVPLQTQNSTFKVYQSDGSIVDQELINQIYNYLYEELPEHESEEPMPVGRYTRGMVVEYLKKHRAEATKDEEFLKNILRFIDQLIVTLEASNDSDDVVTGGDYEELEGSRGTSWHKYGYKTFFEIILNTYNKGAGLPTLETKLNTEVTQIKYPLDPNEEVEVTTKDGTVYRAKSVIVTVSLGVLKEKHAALFSPPLPKEKIVAIEKISMGLLGKIILYYDEPFWPLDKNLCYFLFWKNEDKQKLAEKDRWILNVTGPSMSMGNDHTLTLWSSGDNAKNIENLPEEDVVDNCINYLSKFFGKVPRPNRLIRSTWFKNPFTRGSYTFDNMLMPQYPHLRDSLAQPLTDSARKPRVLFAGEATNKAHFGTVHGASETGYREAMRLLSTGPSP